MTQETKATGCFVWVMSILVILAVFLFGMGLGIVIGRG